MSAHACGQSTYDSTSYNVGPPLDGDPSEFISDKELLGDILEEEYYTSQVVRNRKSYFETPKDKIFTQSFLPLEGEIKGTVYCYRGGRTCTSKGSAKICMSFSTWGYAVFTANLLGHGRSDGIRCYMVHGGLAILLMYFQSDPDTWTVLIFSAPLFVIPEDMKPSKPHLLADTWTAMLDNKMVGKAIHHPEKLKIIASNPQRYTGKPRVRTMREILRKTQYVQDNFGRVIIPLMTVHGTYDGVTCPSSSTLLYEKASRTDKTLKLYDGMYHSLIQGEPEENAATVLKDMREWIDERVKRY
ncbi:hypothetical protein YC2023_065568 [Brassica napus]